MRPACMSDSDWSVATDSGRDITNGIATRGGHAVFGVFRLMTELTRYSRGILGAKV